MKKTLSVICIIFAVIIIVLFMNLRQLQSDNRAVKTFNSGYEFYNREDLCGVDITTVINKAYDNNEKFEVKKDDKGYYIPDDEDSIKIYVKLKNSDNTYEMERIKEIGLTNFVEFFRSN